MNKFLAIMILSLLWCNVINAEIWSCNYQFDNEKLKIQFERNGNEFIATRPGGISREPIIIIKENKNIIHLYQHNDPDKVDSRMTITFLDKTHKSFSMIGLERSESTATISGSCVIY
tara:strand:- start:10 stop:360 length:351 start_codon:yes stop_codon:yes gene_type:complete